MSAGRRRAERSPGPGPLRGVVARATGVLLGAVAWGLLVVAAISFGRAARNGEGTLGWAFTIAATIGAAACLLLVFVLVSQLAHAARGRVRHEPGRHR